MTNEPLKVYRVFTNSLGYFQMSYIAVADSKESARSLALQKIRQDGESYEIVQIEELFEIQQGQGISDLVD